MLAKPTGIVALADPIGGAKNVAIHNGTIAKSAFKDARRTIEQSRKLDWANRIHRRATRTCYFHTARSEREIRWKCLNFSDNSRILSCYSNRRAQPQWIRRMRSGQCGFFGNLGTIGRSRASPRCSRISQSYRVVTRGKRRVCPNDFLHAKRQLSPCGRPNAFGWRHCEDQ
jgi:hypothetical protein